MTKFDEVQSEKLAKSCNSRIKISENHQLNGIEGVPVAVDVDFICKFDLID